jgi:hypothetical protein
MFAGREGDAPVALGGQINAANIGWDRLALGGRGFGCVVLCAD